jgi:hypothetical protein
MDEIQQLCLRLGGMKQDLVHAVNEAQKALRAFVTDKSYPLEARFEVWEAWCDKEHHNWITVVDDPFIRRLIDDECPYEYDRYRTYDWSFFLDIFDQPGPREEYGVTLDDVMEKLIADNFGSYESE